MADINLLKDTKDPEEAKGKNKRQINRQIEYSQPEEKISKKGTLASEAPESIWSKLFGVGKKKKKSEKKPKKPAQAKSGKLGKVATSEPIVMEKKPGQEKEASQKEKKVVMPEKPAQKDTQTEPFIAQKSDKTPDDKEEKKPKKSPVLPPTPPVKKKEKAGFFQRLFKKPKVEKVPQAPNKREIKEEDKKKAELPKQPEVKVPPKPEIKKEKAKEKEKEAELPKEPKKEEKESFWARLFKKPKVKQVPAAAALLKKKEEEAKEKGKDESEEKPMSEAEELEPSAFGVNLMPEEFEGNIALVKKRLWQLGLIVLGVIVLFVLVYLGLVFYESNIESKTSEVELEISLVEDNIKQYRDVQQQAIDLNRRITVIRQLLANHIYWTNFFEKLEENTIDNVYYTSLGGDLSGGRITLSARAASFLDVGKQLIAFQEADDLVQSVEISAARQSAEQTALSVDGTIVNKPVVDFSVSLKVLPAVFNKPLEEEEEE